MWYYWGNYYVLFSTLRVITFCLNADYVQEAELLYDSEVLCTFLALE